jgi:prepilin-type processing-associated H-X9-DG protein
LPDPLTTLELDQRIDSGKLQVAPTFVGGFGSSHVGNGANFAFGDGSVRFLKQTIDPTVYQRLGHRCDGELIDGDAY